MTVHWTASDALSGLAGAAPADKTITTEGANLSATASVSDKAGNSASATVSGINIDKTAPTLSGAATTQANANGWYNHDVAVAWTAADALSGLAGAAPADKTITTEGANQSVSASVQDKAGNSTSASVSGINIDKTGPTLSGAATTQANANGWYNHDVAVGFTAADALSGVDTVSGPTTLSTEGTNQSVQGSATDKAGNSASVTVSGINIDKTGPTLSGAATTQANANGWYNHDVAVHWTAADALSGIDGTAPADASLTTEGANQSVSASVLDKAGNSTSASVSGINIDKTGPTLSGAATTQANANGWYNHDVAVGFTAADALSGVDTVSGPTTLSTEGTNQSVQGSATDKAGNSASVTVSGINIDKTGPTLSGAATTQANANGWYNHDVAVHWTAADALSGIDGTAPADASLTTEGANQSVSASVLDKAGNSTSASVSGINIDKTGPTLSGAATTQANANGWYNHDVAVGFTAADALSGVDTVSGVTTLSTEGTNQSVQGSATDKAGNSASVTVSGINIDKTGPTLSGAATTQANANGWYNHDVAVGFTAADALSGVDTVSGVTTLSTEGTNQSVQGSATDKAGNSASVTVSGINIDKTGPTLSGAATTQANANGWYNHDVAVAWTAADALSGLAGAAPADKTITTEGANQSVSASVQDKAGNSTSASVSGINIDKTGPTLSGAATTQANANGWYNHDVAVGFTAADSLSGVDTVSGPTTLSTEGTNQSVQGSATDKAGNSASVTVSGINIDKTGPTLSGAATTQANANGWYNHDVAVHWTAADALSGIDGTAPADASLTTEGANQSVSASVLDKAGNSTSASVSGINIDKTGPTLSGAATTQANANGWYKGDVAVHWTAADALSGLDGAAPADASLTTEGANQSVSASTSDKAGNSTSTTVSGINIDKTGPTLSGAATTQANANGWYNHDVAVHWTAADALSGLDGAAPADASLTTEGANQSVSASVLDKAGNSTSASVSGINIDKTGPTLSGAATTQANANGWYNHDVAVGFTAADSLSGVDTVSGVTTLSTEGTNQSVQGSATDKAGNSASVTVSGINIDKTGPTLSGAATTQANANGWYKGDVAVHWTAADALSGLDGAAPADASLTTEGANQSASASVQDKAGNSTSASVSGINIDKTGPTLSGAATTQANANGWYNHDVAVHWTAADALSGLDGAAPADASLTTEGANRSVSASVQDKAGNSASVTVSGINIDKTAPTGTGSHSDGTYTTVASDTLLVSAADALSGVASVQFYDNDVALRTPVTAVDQTTGKYTLAATNLTEGKHVFTAVATDKAGNQSGSMSVGTTLVDTTAPVTSITDITQSVTKTGSTTLVSGSSEANSTVTLLDTNGTTVLGTANADSAGHWNTTLTNLSNVVHNFTAKATDLAGNVGSSSQVAIFGTTGNDVIKAVPGGGLIVGSTGNDNMTAGVGIDNFVFHANLGKNVISGFDVFQDILSFDHNLFAGITDASKIINYTADVNGNATVIVDPNDTVTLLGVTKAQLQAHLSDFHLL
ncbi:Ig-like domain-containing protein [Methylobacterium sp. CB376]|uniref:beta strand repeat-containing protein n=1 Tax=unclassified Methylobacterium TaxID=2615210 RepID=UPI0005BE05FF|nr:MULTISPECIES: Ig-like domain-containing protein [Methylobacterium]WFT83443.1 Ig-like domain-containing protein [Methylobacterium nodulans]